MFENSEKTEAEPWLKEAFVQKGGTEPHLLRNISCPVWTDGRKLVAKIYTDTNEGRKQAADEQNAARTVYDTSVPTAVCHGIEKIRVDEHREEVVSWWEWVKITGPGKPENNLTLLKRLHDSFHVNPGVPYMQQPSLPEEAFETEAKDLAQFLLKYQKPAQEAWESLQKLEKTVIHGDANPTNLVETTLGPIMLDYGCTQWAPRIVDVATVAVLAVETGQGTFTQIIDFYNNIETRNSNSRVLEDENFKKTVFVEQVRRAWSCVKHPQWEKEGWERLESLEKNENYVFKNGNRPK